MTRPLPAPKQIICMKWGSLFPAAYVNALYSACRKHTTGPLVFVCMTDNPAGLDTNITAQPIPDIGLDASDWYTPGVWPKLSLFAANLCGLSGKVLFIDLDMLIVGSLDPFFDTSADLTAIDVGKNWHPDRSGHPVELGTGIFSFTVGKQAQILAAFQADKAAAMRDFANEQDFVAAHVTHADFWPKQQVTSFKRFYHHRYGMGLLRHARSPNPATAVVAFHGTPRPIDIVRQKFWGRFPHLGAGSVDWIDAYWSEHARL